MMEFGSSLVERKRLRQQRAALEHPLGYDRLPKPSKSKTRRKPSAAEDEALHEFLRDARQRMRAALDKQLGPNEKLPIPSFE